MVPPTRQGWRRFRVTRLRNGQETSSSNVGGVELGGSGGLRRAGEMWAGDGGLGEHAVGLRGGVAWPRAICLPLDHGRCGGPINGSKQVAAERRRWCSTAVHGGVRVHGGFGIVDQGFGLDPSGNFLGCLNTSLPFSASKLGLASNLPNPQNFKLPNPSNPNPNFPPFSNNLAPFQTLSTHLKPSI